MRLLLVEDDQNLSDAIAEQLQKEGYITDCCYDGETALHYALNPEYGYDIVLLDRMLPIIDGLTVLKAMRQKQIFTPVLILTGLGELEDKIEGLDCGADDYLVKPFHIRELLARIRALTRRPVEIQEKDNHGIWFGAGCRISAANLSGKVCNPNPEGNKSHYCISGAAGYGTEPKPASLEGLGRQYGSGRRKCGQLYPLSEKAPPGAWL